MTIRGSTGRRCPYRGVIIGEKERKREREREREREVTAAVALSVRDAAARSSMPADLRGALFRKNPTLINTRLYKCSRRSAIGRRGDR